MLLEELVNFILPSVSGYSVAVKCHYDTLKKVECSFKFEFVQIQDYFNITVKAGGLSVITLRVTEDINKALILNSEVIKKLTILEKLRAL